MGQCKKRSYVGAMTQWGRICNVICDMVKLTHMYASAHVHVQTHARARTRAHTNARARARTHTHTLTHAYAHEHAYAVRTHPPPPLPLPDPAPFAGPLRRPVRTTARPVRRGKAVFNIALPGRGELRQLSPDRDGVS